MAWGDNDFNIAPGGEARLARGLFVSGDFFRVLGVKPLMGRVFTAADDQRGCGLPGAVVSYSFWQRELAGDSSAIGTGFRQNGILIAGIDLSRLSIPVDHRIEFKLNLLARVRAVPGVISAAEASIIPISGSAWDNAVWKEEAAATPKAVSNFNSVGPTYFRTLGITLLAGRDFDDHDTASSPKVAIVDQSFARKLGLGPDPSRPSVPQASDAFVAGNGF